MTTDPWTLRHFNLAARGHLHAADSVLRHQSDSGQMPTRTAASAAYLAHVALECAMKARLLYRDGCDSVKDLARKSPNVSHLLFKTSKGHDLTILSEKLALSRVVKLDGKTFANDACWKRLCSEARPYSLRYGTEEISEKDAREDVSRSRELTDVLLSGIQRSPRK